MKYYCVSTETHNKNKGAELHVGERGKEKTKVRTSPDFGVTQMNGVRFFPESLTRSPLSRGKTKVKR